MKREQKNVNGEGVNVKSTLNLRTFQNKQFVNTREAMIILGIKSQTTIGKYETESKIKA